MAHTPFSLSTTSILRVFLVGFACWLVYAVRETLLLIFISFILATILHPLVVRLEKYKIPRSVAIIVLYLLATALFVGVGWALVPLFVSELSQIAQHFGEYWDQVMTLLPGETGVMIKEAVQKNLNSLASAAQTGISVTLSSLLSTVQGFINVAGSVIIVLVLGFYFVVEERSIKNGLLHVLPAKHVPLAERLWVNSQFWLGGWARGQLILSLIIGVCVFIALTAIGVPYAFALAALAALFEFVPYVGPILSGVFGVFFAFTISPMTALIAAIAYYIIQMLENNVIVPKVMQKAAGVNPVLSMIMILLCFELLGIVGVFLGVPVASLTMAVVESIDRSDDV